MHDPPPITAKAPQRRFCRPPDGIVAKAGALFCAHKSIQRSGVVNVSSRRHGVLLEIEDAETGHHFVETKRARQRCLRTRQTSLPLAKPARRPNSNGKARRAGGNRHRRIFACAISTTNINAVRRTRSPKPACGPSSVREMVT